MNRVIQKLQDDLLRNRERIALLLKKYPNVMSVGVGLKEVSGRLTSLFCYRVYVTEKKDLGQLPENDKIPSEICGFMTDIIPYGIIENILELTIQQKEASIPTRPLRGGIPIKNDYYSDAGKQGIGTLGCLAISNESNRIVGLTCHHVVSHNSEDNDPKNEIAQPYKVEKCFSVKNIIGRVVSSLKDSDHDCAIIELTESVESEIKKSGFINKIIEIGSIKGRSEPILEFVKKRGAGTGLTHGKIVDIAFDGEQMLIAPINATDKFADFGDSGSIILTEDNLVIGLLWGTKRHRFKADTELFGSVADDPHSLNNISHEIPKRVHGVATPIGLIESALHIKIPLLAEPHPSFTISVHESDLNTYLIKSMLPETSTPKKHFVTVAKTNVNENDIDDDIILQVSFDGDVNTERLEWTIDSGKIIFPAIGTNKLTAKISRLNKQDGLKANVGIAINGIPIGEPVFVWIIWSTEKRYGNGDFKIDIDEGVIISSRTFNLDFQILPPEIIPHTADDDVPDLTGKNLSRPPNVPEGEPEVFNSDVDLGDGAEKKWDMSMSVKTKLYNPSHITFDTRDSFYRSYPKYPSLSTVGNHDTSTAFTDTIGNNIDPYHPSQLGILSCGVEIRHILRHNLLFSSADVGRKIGLKIYHRTFSRLELNGKWYIISDFWPGRIFLNYEFWREYIAPDGKRYFNVWFSQIGNIIGDGRDGSISTFDDGGDTGF